jgi:hypothetical protein
MYQYACKVRAGIVIVSEPNKQQAYWYNDTKSDASIWVTLFSDAHPSEDTIVQEDGVAAIKIDNIYVMSGYCSPNINKYSSYIYPDKLERLIETIQSKIILANDYHAKSTAGAIIKQTKREER